MKEVRAQNQYHPPVEMVASGSEIIYFNMMQDSRSIDASGTSIRDFLGMQFEQHIPRQELSLITVGFYFPPLGAFNAFEDTPLLAAG